MIRVNVHKFNMGDVEDPDLWAGATMADWQKSERGSWVMENAKDPTWVRSFYEYGWQYTIVAEMSEEQYTYYKLKYE